MNDARRSPDGWQYGVMFMSDGSVWASWNGQTQAQRALEERDRLREEYPRERFELCRRIPPTGHWFPLYDAGEVDHA